MFWVCLGLVQGNSYTINCPYRTPVQKWDIQRTNASMEVIISQSTMDLTVTNVNESDEGFYRCHADARSGRVVAPAACIFVLGMLHFYCTYIILQCIFIPA